MMLVNAEVIELSSDTACTVIDLRKSYQWRWAGVHELMLSSRRNDNKIPRLDFLILSRNDCFASAESEGERLINSVDL